MRPVIKSSVLAVILIVAFITSAILTIFISVNLAVAVSTSNRQLDESVKRLQDEGYDFLFTEFNPANLEVRTASINEFENLVTSHNPTIVYANWAKLAFPFQVIYGKIWFTDEGTTYWLETSW